jgi:uncharacterized membrane protein YqaE (UPF0057 family)
MLYYVGILGVSPTLYSLFNSLMGSSSSSVTFFLFAATLFVPLVGYSLVRGHGMKDAIIHGALVLCVGSLLGGS